MIERTFYLNFTKPLLLKEFCAEKEPTKLKKNKKLNILCYYNEYFVIRNKYGVNE